MKSSLPEALKPTLHKAWQSDASQCKPNWQALDIIFEASNKEGSKTSVCVVSAQISILTSREEFCLH